MSRPSEFATPAVRCQSTITANGLMNTPPVTMTRMRDPMLRRGLRSASELGLQRNHGDRLRYLSGCRCFACRRANSAYEAQRKIARAAGDWNGIVSAAPAQAHIHTLSGLNVGRRQVADASGVAESVVAAIRSGLKARIRARTEKRILAVSADAIADRALVDAGPTWKLLSALMMDYPKARLARELGYRSPALQLGRNQVTARSALEIERLYERLVCVRATKTTSLLRDLASEGYRRVTVEKMLEKRAGFKVELDPRKDRVRATTEKLVAALHAELTDCPESSSP